MPAIVEHSTPSNPSQNPSEKKPAERKIPTSLSVAEKKKSLYNAFSAPKPTGPGPVGPAATSQQAPPSHHNRATSSSFSQPNNNLRGSSTAPYHAGPGPAALHQQSCATLYPYGVVGGAPGAAGMGHQMMGMGFPAGYPGAHAMMQPYVDYTSGYHPSWGAVPVHHAGVSGYPAYPAMQTSWTQHQQKPLAVVEPSRVSASFDMGAHAATSRSLSHKLSSAGDEDWRRSRSLIPQKSVSAQRLTQLGESSETPRISTVTTTSQGGASVNSAVGGASLLNTMRMKNKERAQFGAHLLCQGEAIRSPVLESAGGTESPPTLATGLSTSGLATLPAGCASVYGTPRIIPEAMMGAGNTFSLLGSPPGSPIHSPLQTASMAPATLNLPATLPSLAGMPTGAGLVNPMSSPMIAGLPPGLFSPVGSAMGSPVHMARSPMSPQGCCPLQTQGDFGLGVGLIRSPVGSPTTGPKTGSVPSFPGLNLKLAAAVAGRGGSSGGQSSGGTPTPTSSTSSIGSGGNIATLTPAAPAAPVVSTSDTTVEDASICSDLQKQITAAYSQADQADRDSVGTAGGAVLGGRCLSDRTSTGMELEVRSDPLPSRSTFVAREDSPPRASENRTSANTVV